MEIAAPFHASTQPQSQKTAVNKAEEDKRPERMPIEGGGGGGDGDVPSRQEGMLAVFLFFLLMSAAGSVILLWWTLNYQTAHDQLWMVPVGLVMLAAPVVIGFSIVASETTPSCIASLLPEKYNTQGLRCTYPSSKHAL